MTQYNESLFFKNKLHSLYFSWWSLGLQHRNSEMGLYKMVSESLIGRLSEYSLFPEVGGERAVGFGDGIKCGLSEVAQGSSAASGRGVAVVAVISSFLGTGAETMSESLGLG